MLAKEAFSALPIGTPFPRVRVGRQGAEDISSAAGGQRDSAAGGGGEWSCHALKDQVAQKWPK